MKANHLSSEKSPYLLQHAHNPIDWYPWGEEAFQKAQREDKPIFLSIGYSTCHWCHVMAHESFEDEEVATYMNEHYVAIKVDREERPDIDSLYMKVCQMMTGQGGWPLTIVMTPDQTPYYAGTYFPRDGRHGLPGIMEVLSQLSNIYKNDIGQLTEIKESVHGALQQTIQKKSDTTLTGDTVVKAYQEMAGQFDSVFGGFGGGQKFPQPHNLLFLLHYYRTTKEEKALQMVEHTVDKMLSGGIWDHIGFGFSRYTVDRRWQTPHFEKMLYDNAMLLMVLTTCYQITKKSIYQTTAAQLITFLEREMKSVEGAFYSAIDADSEGEEGKFYVWDFLEIYQTLDEETADHFVERHRMTTRGNFEGKTIIQGPPVDEEVRLQLLAEREKRVRPHTDDKILTSWNSLLIAALARASKVFENDAYLSLALEATAFIEGKLTQDGRLMARYRDGETKHKAYLDDYAFLSWSYLELYEATYDLNLLKKALKTAEDMERLFWDEAEGGFFFSGRDGEQLLIRDKEVSEGAMPSGNGIASMVYAKLAKLTGEAHYTDRLYALYQLFYRDIERAPSASPSLLQSLLISEYPGKEVVIIGNDDYFMKKLSENYLPNTVVLVAESSEAFENVAEFARLYPQVNNETTIYVCENFVCQRPTNDMAQALEMLIY